jgi:hypothetical protein
MKKIILPIGILAGVGIIYYFIKNRKPKVVMDKIQVPIPIDNPSKMPLYDELLKTIADQHLASEKILRPSDSQSQQITNANIKASKRYGCMSNDLRNMSVADMNALIDFLKNGMPSEIIKFNKYIEISKKYPLTWSDNPCGNLCIRDDGSQYISSGACGKTSFNGLKGLK